MQKNYNENLVAGAAIRDDKGRRISKLFEASHPKMTVGYARNLIMPDTPTEQEFNFRQAGGGVIEDGVAVIDKVKGNSMVWNQLIKDFRESSNWIVGGNDVTVVGDKIHIKFASTSLSNAFGVKSSAFSAGHKYCLLMNNENAMPLTAIKLGSASSVSSSSSTISTTKTPLITAATTTSSESAGALWFWPSDETKLEGDFSNIYAIDLTQMFGAGNEPSTYEEFLSRKPKVADEYAYNEGTIVNNKVEMVKTTGVNLWDEEWEQGSVEIYTGENESSDSYIRSKNYIPIISGRTYYCTGSPGVRLYDGNKKYLGYSAFDDETHTLTFSGTKWDVNLDLVKYARIVIEGTTYNHDICINLSDPSINGQYFPYEKHELDLSWVKDIKDAEGVKLFEDGMKSAGTAFDEVRKNKAVKRIGVVDLGNLTWTYKKGSLVGDIFYSQNFNAKDSNLKVDWVSSKYANTYNATQMYGVGKDADKVVFIEDGDKVKVKDSAYTDAASFKAAVQGVLLYYELATPIEVEYDEKNLSYPVIAGGTEEAIASEPSTAFRADIGYGIDAVKTILDLKARVEALEGK